MIIVQIMYRRYKNFVGMVQSVEHILIMDSPIQAMKDKDGIELSNGQYEYITNNSSFEPVIIIDN